MYRLEGTHLVPRVVNGKSAWTQVRSHGPGQRPDYAFLQYWESIEWKSSFEDKNGAHFIGLKGGRLFYAHWSDHGYHHIQIANSVPDATRTLLAEHNIVPSR